ncbi:MAG TPA: antitoxin [Candidatus Marinimicrobia bacterium]|nr:antitoxin [Candidatus Neomarinimicrobiota bacterium]
MDNEILTWLFDIKLSIEEIESYFSDGERKYELFINDLRTKRAVERNLEIIGEALKRILDKDDSIRITNARKIVDTRNRIIHGYDSVSDEIIWGIIVRHLPGLKKEINELMDD